MEYTHLRDYKIYIAFTEIYTFLKLLQCNNSSQREPLKSTGEPVVFDSESLVTSSTTLYSFMPNEEIVWTERLPLSSVVKDATHNKTAATSGIWEKLLNI